MARLFLSVTQRRMRKIRKTAVRMEDRGSYLMTITMKILVKMIMVLMKMRRRVVTGHTAHYTF